jgi:hypothetical protein
LEPAVVRDLPDLKEADAAAEPAVIKKRPKVSELVPPIRRGLLRKAGVPKNL